MERAPFEDRPGSSSDPYRIQRLDEPALRRGTTGEEHVGASVEEDDNGHMRDTASGFLQVDVEADRHPSHVAYLKIGDHKVGRVLLDGRSHAFPATQLADLCFAVLECRTEVLKDRIGVTDDQNEVHSSRLVVSEQVAGDDPEAFQIVHVFFEKGNLDHRGGCDLARQVLDVALLTTGDNEKVLEVATQFVVGNGAGAECSG